MHFTVAFEPWVPAVGRGLSYVLGTISCQVHILQVEGFKAVRVSMNSLGLVYLAASPAGQQPHAVGAAVGTCMDSSQ